MTKESLLKLIQESKSLLSTASPEQKIRLLKVLRDSYSKLQEQKQAPVEILTETSADYLDER